MGWNPVKEVKKWYNKVKGAAESGIKTLKRETEKQINRVKWYAKKGIEQVESETKKGVSQVKKEVENLPKQAEKALNDALDELAKAVAKEGLEKAGKVAKTAKKELDELAKSDPDLVDEINELGFTVEVGPMTLAYSGFYERADQVIHTLDTYTNAPPVFRRKPLLDMIEALGPTSVDFGANIRAAFVVASSDALSVGVSLDAIRLRLFTRLGDKLLAALGVPK